MIYVYIYIIIIIIIIIINNELLAYDKHNNYSAYSMYINYVNMYKYIVIIMKLASCKAASDIHLN